MRFYYIKLREGLVWRSHFLIANFQYKLGDQDTCYHADGGRPVERANQTPGITIAPPPPDYARIYKYVP